MGTTYGLALGYHASVAVPTRVNTPTFREYLGILFARARQARGLNVNTVGEPGVGPTGRAVADVDNARGNPGWNTLQAYAERLGYKLEDFFAAALHPESEDAFGHPDVQRFIRIWKRSSEEQRAMLMATVLVVEGQIRSSEGAAPGPARSGGRPD